MFCHRSVIFFKWRDSGIRLEKGRGGNGVGVLGREKYRSVGMGSIGVIELKAVGDLGERLDSRGWMAVGQA